MRKRGIAQLELYDGEHISVKSPFNADFVDNLKAQLPSKARWWEPDTRRWIVDSDYQAELEALCEEYFSVVHWIGLTEF